MSRAIIVTGGDSRYFPLMTGCLQSVARNLRDRGPALGVLDCGLDDAQKAWCESIGASVIEPKWDVAFAPHLSIPSSFRAMTARPHLRDYFPGFDTYLWLDGDVWVQDWSAVELLLASAQQGDIAVVPEIHRSYSNFRGSRDDFEAANGKAYADAFGGVTAERLIRLPLNNAGVFAMRANSPAWQVWADLLSEAARRSGNMIDQIALNVAIYDKGLREVRLPARCNWIAHLARPAWDRERKILVEPDPPFEPIGILHMTLDTKWQETLPLPVAGEPDATILKPLRYPG